MARKKTPEKRQVLPDPICGSQLVAKFINSVMREGKKSVAEKIVYGAFERMLTLSKAAKKKEDEKEGDGGESRAKSGTGGKAGLRPYKDKIIELFSKAIENVQPTVEVRARRVGGATYQIPVEVPLNRRMALAMRWLIESAEGRGGRTMAFRLADEIMDALHNRGGAVKKRENVHAMAHANRAFAHFRWS